jgi:hypothetical protein
VPGTDDRTNIQGALHPLSLRFDLQGGIPNLTAPCDEKTFSSEVTVAKPVKSTTSFHFREGDHSGEASLEEIVTGFDDGELSHQCQIFDTDMDEWVVISVFLDRHGIGIPIEALADQTAEGLTLAPRDNTKSTLIRMTDAMIDDAIIQIDEDDDDFPLLDKHDKKKPARHSSNWGKGQLLTLDANLVEEVPTPINHINDISLRTKKVGHVKPPAKLMRTVTQAMVQWDMVKDGDRLLLGLSGGKDSLSLLHVLLEFQRKLPFRFDIEVRARSLLAKEYCDCAGRIVLTSLR